MQYELRFMQLVYVPIRISSSSSQQSQNNISLTFTCQPQTITLSESLDATSFSCKKTEALPIENIELSESVEGSKRVEKVPQNISDKREKKAGQKKRLKNISGKVSDSKEQPAESDGSRAKTTSKTRKTEKTFNVPFEVKTRSGSPFRLWCHIYIHCSKNLPSSTIVPGIIGRNGCNMKKIHEKTGAKLRIRGQGSGHLEGRLQKEAQAPLMIAVTADRHRDGEHFREAVCMLLSHLQTIEARFAALSYGSSKLFSIAELSDTSLIHLKGLV